MTSIRFIKLTTVLILLLVSGVNHVAGDMFIKIPKGDAIFMKVSSIFISTNK